MEDKTISFKLSVLCDLCDLLPRLYGNRIVVQSPLKLPWGLISWDSQGYSITVKGGQIPSPVKRDLPLPVKPSEGLFRVKIQSRMGKVQNRPKGNNFLKEVILVDKKMRLSIRICLDSDMADHLEISETAEMGQVEFLEMAKILGQFHDLISTFKKQEKK